MSRRLPVYLVIDVSGSMNGEPIQAVQNGIDMLVSDLRDNPQALETAYMSVITFDNEARQVVPLTDLLSFQTPTFSAGGRTALGPALSLLRECSEREVKRSTKEHKGDYKPLVFLFTDGLPNEGDLEKGIADFQRPGPHRSWWGTTISCAAGNADVEILKRITPTGAEEEKHVVRLETLSSGALRKFFAWISTSIKATSEKANDGNLGSQQTGVSALPAPPPEVVIV